MNAIATENTQKTSSIMQYVLITTMNELETQRTKIRLLLCPRFTFTHASVVPNVKNSN